MRQLLDTHSFIWFVMGNPRISPRLRSLIEDNQNLLSIASVWEMAIKHSSGKLSFGLPFRIFIEQQLSLNSIELLSINLDHIDVIAALPFHHRDPFDRLLIAQSMVERIPILSADSAFDAYPITRLW
ncbi:type II toxin-antitoxin system VapC family toxin [Funiculus sociatus GB2-A5]|uniref:Type II toxin-antitoxin system VapC family toxin n=1 Tax=Funiculus sociatus GB2-A5 TaxID=2933946 RepID=A0ABV0JX39_9CYAN|nr:MULTISPECIES: type II toxin-antitoxin system VapC family toxin [unclassified Trichocoleus]MBD1835038.1 type II toxin-antitoxin system VapC family toxin [Cyanobacteria bacterium FACHB-472]MBD1907978.1 type II toxin-antitoxin system VapC family toxin [Trichocoleus sp. FACHB-832]MBD2065119.1 type II toxin-antitoxin system VapC family toxin [Trichocoleus sp. FACHB-6]